MRLVKEVTIENLRSIRRLTLSDLDEYIPIVGLNGTGKSNLLRALNLFFNGYLDEDKSLLDLARDYPDSLRKSKSRKRIAVTVTFDLTTGFEVRGTQPLLESRGIKSQIVIEWVWNVAPGGLGLQDTFRFGADLEQLELVDEAEKVILLSFIRGVHYSVCAESHTPSRLYRR